MFMLHKVDPQDTLNCKCTFLVWVSSISRLCACPCIDWRVGANLQRPQPCGHCGGHPGEGDDNGMSGQAGPRLRAAGQCPPSNLKDVKVDMSHWAISCSIREYCSFFWDILFNSMQFNSKFYVMLVISAKKWNNTSMI